MKYILLLFTLVFSVTIASAQYKPVDDGSALKFTIGNFGFDVNGSFSGLGGKIDFDPQNVTNANFDVTIEAATVNTDNSLRDQHLKGENYFDVKNYSRIRLVSAKVTSAGGHYTFSGQLTIKGKSKEITFPFTAVPVENGYQFKGSFKINRKDFGVGGTSTIANELQVNLTIHVVKA